MITISTIQHFSVGDGEGIRTTVFFKGCSLCCPWCHNPENLSFEPVTMTYTSPKKIEVVGKRIQPQDLLPELLEDKAFYDESGGGVTFSGGEVMLQADGAAELASLLKRYGVSVLIDTAGCVPYGEFEKLNGVVDGYLLDFKTSDAVAYDTIGGNLPLIKENIEHLLKDGMKVHIRIPLIPHFNADEDSLRAMCRDLISMGIRRVELLPFHRLGSGKYTALGWHYAYEDIPSMNKKELGAIQRLFCDQGLEALQGG